MRGKADSWLRLGQGWGSPWRQEGAEAADLTGLVSRSSAPGSRAGSPSGGTLHPYGRRGQSGHLLSATQR